MAALKEARSYGLSCGRLGDGSRVSVFHVKLTDSALRAFESYRASQDSVSLRPSIRFQDSQGHICVPQPDCPSEARTFSFYLSNIGRDSPQGSFDCVQQYLSSRGDVHLDCLGSIQDKITVCATDDSYQKARQSLAQAEEETRSRSAIVIKPGGRYLGKKVHFRKPAPGPTDAVPSRKRATPVNPASALKKASGGGSSGGVSQRPFRDRVLHLLALRPYRKAELLLRLQRDGLSQPDKDALDGLLQQVANVSAKDGTCTLKDSMYKDVQRDWPGYSEGDRQLLQRMLVRKVCQPQGASTFPSDPAASPPGEHGNASSLLQKRPQPSDFIDPLASKKPRISHFAQRTQPAVNGKLSAPHGRTTPLLPLPEPPRPHDPLADVSNDPIHGGRDSESLEAGGPGSAERLHPPPSPDCTRPSRPHGKAKKKSKKHRDKERVPEDQHQGSQPDPEPAESSGSTLGAPPDAPGKCGGTWGAAGARLAHHTLYPVIMWTPLHPGPRAWGLRVPRGGGGSWEEDKSWGRRAPDCSPGAGGRGRLEGAGGGAGRLVVAVKPSSILGGHRVMGRHCLGEGQRLAAGACGLPSSDRAHLCRVGLGGRCPRTKSREASGQQRGWWAKAQG
ncbi:RNA polymerase II elongation factor ELL isoform X1 [Elephas maximus indicus]|uniref:RNA polymerase II elongation factor ELL isoform X1 n=1 Tax=Elephas maximus indicus TaxID=99487 RepID=UPI002116B5C6|nr:RNA polymerase II elongation factor ELL isoform X1 [Elephas maximus indicus]